MINKKDHPLILLKAVRDLYKEVRATVESNRDIMDFAKNTEFEITLIDSIGTSDFTFGIEEPKFENDKVTFQITFKPKSENDVSKVERTSEAVDVAKRLKTWIGLLRQYNDISLTPQEKILNDYEEEFYSDFEIVDPDAATNSFDLPKQAILHKFLTETIQTIESKGDGYAELIEEAKELRDSVPKLTKQNTIRKLSRFFANVRQKSMPLLTELLQSAKKELFKRAIDGGFKVIGEFLENIT